MTVDEWEYSIQIPHDPLGVGVARGALRLMLRAHGLDELLMTAELLASELVTNAHEHSTGPASLRVKWAHKTLRLTVWDTNPEPPRPVEAVGDGADSESGRGLWIVHELADRWGHYSLREGLLGAGGKLVWCEIAGP
ncbi:ATP-binding protein [Streptomyces sp. 21So2-11]|uniref:ATP-binding protein n=1 Tax=Streptomyces sp. 21So2-11 TaxID=3144408 RepID=UPI003219A3A6